MQTCVRSILASAVSLAAVPAGATAYTATPATFAAVFMNARSGDSIKLSGNFGGVTLVDRSFAVPLKIDATNATFSNTLLIQNVQGLAFTGGYYGSRTVATRYNKAVAASFSSNISFTKAYVVGANTGQGIAFAGSTNVSVTASVFDSLRSGVGITGTTGGVVSKNKSIKSPSDGFDIVDSHFISVTGNTCSAGAPTPGAHPDCVQLYSLAGNAPQSDIQVTDNFAYGPTQGFTSFNADDGGGVRINISRNVVKTSYSQGVACYGCTDSIFTYNTLTTLPGSTYRTNLNIIGGSGNLIYGNTLDGKPAPNETDPLEIATLAPDFFDQIAWTRSTFADATTMAEAGDLVTDPSQSTIPEPAAWATMVIGFGLLGGLRRRQRATAVVA